MNKLLRDFMAWWNRKIIDRNRNIKPLPWDAISLDLPPDKEDDRDYIYSALPITPLTKYSLQKYDSPVGYQQNLSSCTGWAVTAALENLYRNRLVDDLNFNHLSPLYVYYYARYLGAIEYKDAGATIRDAIKAANKYGASLEQFWPYDTNKVFVKPSWLANFNAPAFKIKKYERISGFFSNVPKDIKSALLEKKRIVAGVLVHSNWETARETGMIPAKGSAKQTGAHAIEIVGYNDDTQLFTFKNSWGRWWGKSGYGYLSYDYIRRYEQDVWAITI